MNLNKDFKIMHLHANRVNIGDDAIIYSIHKSFSSIFEKVKFIDVSPIESIRSSDPIENYIPLNKFYLPKHLLKLLKSFYKTDLLICGGGDLITGFIPYLGIIAMAKILRIPAVFYSIGVNLRSASKIQKFYSKIVLNIIDAIILRENDSANELKEMGIPSSKIYYAADIVLIFDSFNALEVDSIFDKENIDYHKKLIGVSVRSPEEKCSIWGEREYSSLAKAFDYAVAKFDADVIFIPMLNFENSKFSSLIKLPFFINDETLSNMIIEKMKFKNRAKVIKGTYTATQLLGIISRIEMLIGMRLHSLILALNSAVPFISLSYAPKTRRFMKLLDQEELCIDTINIDSDALSRKLDYVWSLRKNLRETLKEKHNDLKKRALLNTEVAVRFIKKENNKLNFFLLLLPAVIFLYLFHFPLYCLSKLNLPFLKALNSMKYKHNYCPSN